MPARRDERGVFGQLLDALGNTVDEQFEIGRSAGGGTAEGRQTVVYNPGPVEFWVRWIGEDGAGGPPGELEVIGRRVDALTGAPVGATFLVSGPGTGGDREVEAIDVAFSDHSRQTLAVFAIADEVRGQSYDGELVSEGALAFPDTRVGQSSTRECRSVCGDDLDQPGECDAPIEVHSLVGLAPPFPITSIERAPAGSCEGSPVGQPATIPAGEQVVYDVGFFPADPLAFEDFLIVRTDRGDRRIAVTGTGVATTAPCADGATTLCLSQGRFRLTVEWTDFDGSSGLGRAAPQLSSETLTTGSR